MTRFHHLLFWVLCSCIAFPSHALDAHKVYNKLIRAIGDKRQEAPRLEVVIYQERVAYYDRQNHLIGIEQAAIDICSGFGAQAEDVLAILLGHELAHFYKNHQFMNINAFGHKLKPEEAAKMKEQEEEADYYGGFFGHLAGYTAYPLLPELLEKVYSSYDFSKTLPGYPTMEERITLARRAEAKLDKLIDLFEAAIYLGLIQTYDPSFKESDPKNSFQYAEECWTYIIQRFQGREIYNNRGVNRAIYGLHLLPGNKVQFSYPFELDDLTRMGTAGRGIKEDEAKEWLRKARKDFERTLILDPAYATAYINLACTQDLLGDYEEARITANKALKKAGNSRQKAKARQIKAIALYHLGQIKEARKLFKEIKELERDNQKKSYWGQLQSWLTNNPEDAFEYSPPSSEENRCARNTEKIGGKNINNLLEDIQIKEIIDLREDGRVRLVENTGKEHRALIFQKYNRYTVMLRTVKNYKQLTAKGIGLGGSMLQLSKAYGRPSRTMSSATGKFVIYEKCGMIFQLDKNDRIKRWLLYDII